MKCKVSGCEEEVRAREMCNVHYMSDRRRRIKAGEHTPFPISAKRECKTFLCKGKHYARGFCRPCYKRQRRNHDTALSMKSYYRRRDEILARRRKRYAEDHEYRKRLQANQRVAYRRKQLEAQRELQRATRKG